MAKTSRRRAFQRTPHVLSEHDHVLSDHYSIDIDSRPTLRELSELFHLIHEMNERGLEVIVRADFEEGQRLMFSTHPAKLTAEVRSNG